ncbi:hypothetical protein GJV09_05160 [Enterobacteriaceae bacterium RIT702]|nr:hypothetical protein [Enterobacteriaceae bacterium RIT702]
MDSRKNRHNPYGTEQDELPQPLSDTHTLTVFDAHVSAYTATTAATPEESFDAERLQKISTGKQLETQAGLIIQNHNSRLEVSEYNWFGYNSKTLLVGEKSTIAFTLGAQGMSEFSFDYFALHNHTTVMNFYDAAGNLIGSEKLLYTGSVTAKQFVIKTLIFTAPSGTQIARAELVTGDEPSVGDYGFHIDNVKWAAAGPLPVNFTFDLMQKDSGTSTTDFITKDGSAGRQVEGTLSRALAFSETLQFWDGSKWVNATVTGMKWKAQDGTAHSADWEYKLRVVDAAGNITPEQSHQVVYDITPPPVQVIFDHMSKDDALPGDWRTTDGSAGRIVSGSLDRAPDAGDVAEYSYDGGKTWHRLPLNGTDWSFTDPDGHLADWQYQIRFTDVAGNVSSPATQDVTLLPGPPDLTFQRMQKDTGSQDDDFITKDGSAGRLVEGTISRALVPGETLEFWDGTKWVPATVTGQVWQVQDNTAHAGGWEYKLRVVDAAGNTTREQSQQVVLDVTPSDVLVTFNRMSKDDGVAGDWETTDGSAGRIVTGYLSKPLLPGDVIEYSTDDGVTWQKLSLSGLSWSFTDPAAHDEDWQYQVRITDIAGNVTEPVVQHAVLLPLAITLRFDQMEKDTGASDSDFITKDGSAGRRVKGTLSRELNTGETLEFWNGTKWVPATASGLTWQAQDDSAHAASWTYKVRVVDASGSTLEDQHQDVVLSPPPAVRITFDHMEKDDGVAGDWRTTDGSAGRTVSGSLDRTLNPGDVVEYSLDGGITWQTAALDGSTWSFTDPAAHGSDWAYQVRISDVAGSIGAPVSQHVVLLPPPPVSLTFTRMEKDSGISASDFITNDGSAGRQVEGTLSRALSAGETLEMWDGAKWVAATVDGLRWQAQDDIEHAASWQYKLRVVNAAGVPFHEQAQNVVLDLALPDAADLSGMGKDSGLDVQNLFTNDGRAGRIYWGTFDKAETGVRVEVTTDGGVTWHEALIDGNKWSWQDDAVHAADWTVQTRITDRAGNTYDGSVHQIRMDTTPPNHPVLINREGDNLTVSLINSNVVAGDKVIVHIDGKNAFYTLTAADIQAGQAVVKLPANIRLSVEYRAAFMDVHGNVSDYFSRMPSILDFEDQAVFRNPVLNRPYDYGLFSTTWLESSSVSYGYHGIHYEAGTKALSISGGSVRLDINNGLKSNKITFELMWVNDPSTTFEFYDGADIVHTYTQPYVQTNTYVTITLPAGKEFTGMKVIARGDWIGIDNLNLHINTDKILPTETVQTIVKDDLISVGDNLDNIFILNNVSDLSKIQTLNGNGGTDTLKLSGAGQTLDLTAFLGKIQSMEVIDLTGSGHNTLNLSLGDVLQQGGKDLFNLSSNVQMVVRGNAGDKVNLSDLLPDKADVGNWSSSGNVTVGGVVYNVWQHSALDAELLVQNGVTTNLINH